MPGSLHIESYGRHDDRELVRMWRASFEHGVGVRDPHPLEEQLAYFHSQVLARHAVRVAMRDGRIAGFVASNAESIGQLYVRRDLLGQGIGSRLLQAAKDGSRGSLWLYTFARNAGARRFYERHGFKATAFGYEPAWQLDDVRYEWSSEGAGP